MDVVNIEFYSITILAILIIDYSFRFKGSFTTASKIWLALSISTLFISISNIILLLTNTYIIKLIALIIYLLSTITSSLLVYIYVKYVFIEFKINIKKEILYIIISILACSFITIIYTFFSGFEYNLHSFDRSFFNKLLTLAIIPNVAINIMYITSELKKKKKIKHKITITLLITVIGLILDTFNDSLFFVSATFTLTSLIMYINKHEQLLDTDPLTGLANKREIEKFINHLKPNLNVAIFNMDINKFKIINDTYGHEKGDFILKDVAKILRESTRERDAVIRNGGDEFLIFAVIKNNEDAKKLLKRLNDNIKIYNETSDLKISISIGWDIYNSTEKTNIDEFNKFLKSIDEKMYIEKEKAHKESV